MARKSVEVDKNKIVLAIKEAEKEGPLENRSVLYNKVCKIYNVSIAEDNNLQIITPAIVGLRIKEWNLQIVTPVGKKGRRSGFSGLDRSNIKRTSRQEKFAANPVIKSAIQDLRKEISRKYKGTYDALVNRIQQGSMKAALKLMCIDCCNGCRKEIENCGATNCPLYAFRPYQNSASGISESEIEVEIEPEVEITAA